MNDSDLTNQRIASMTFASVYPMYLTKVEKKGRTKVELHQVITWLTGFDNSKIQELIQENGEDIAQLVGRRLHSNHNLQNLLETRGNLIKNIL